MAEDLKPDGTWEGEDMDDAADAAWAERIRPRGLPPAPAGQDWLEQYQGTKEKRLEGLDTFLRETFPSGEKGGPGSGHFGHAGRPGKRGGSLPANVAVSIRTGKTARERQQAAAGQAKIPKGAAGARQKLAAIHASYDAPIQRLLDKAEAMRAERDQAVADLRVRFPNGYQDEGYYDEYKKVTPSYGSIVAVDDERRKLEDERKEKEREAVYVDRPSTVGVDTKFRRGRKERVMEGVEAFRKLVGVKTMDKVTVSIVDKPKSSRSSCEGIMLELTKEAGAKTTLHEMGHAWEHADFAAYMSAKGFLNRRTRNERAVPLRTLLPGLGYDADEMAKPDRFLNPYMGKIYGTGVGRGSTEIISMGLETMWTDPHGFATTDPEYFDFIYNLARG